MAYSFPHGPNRSHAVFLFIAILLMLSVSGTKLGLEILAEEI
jgi:hypothetical protein